jgi:hypothetical protein
MISQMPRMVEQGKIPKGMWTSLQVDSKGERNTWYELVKFDAGSVKKDLFEIPAGYTKVDRQSNVDMSELKKEMGKGAKESAGQSASDEAKKMGWKELMKQMKK